MQMRIFFKQILLPVLLLTATTGYAQLQTSRNLTLEAAKKIVAEAVQYARANNAPGGAIAVVDNGGNLVYLERLDGTFPAAAEVSIKKANTAALFRVPSAKLETSINGGRQALITVGHTFLQGGIPIVVDGQVVGAIGVSGAASAQQDEEIALAGSRAKLETSK